MTAVIWYLRNQRRDARSAELANEIETDPATETRNTDPISNFRRVMLETIGVEDALNIRGGHGVLAFLNMPRGRGPFILQNEEERSEFRTWTREGGTNVLGVAANEAAEEDGVCAADEMRLCIAWRTFKNFRDLIADRDAPKTIDIFWELLTDGSIGRLVNPDIDGNVPGINVLVVQVSNKTGETRLVCPTNPLSEGVDPYYSKNI